MVEKKPGFFEKMHKSKKKQVLFFVASMCAFFCVYFPLSDLIYEERESKNVEEQGCVIDDDIMFSIENIDISKNEIQLKGWSLRLNSKVNNIRLVLQANNLSDSHVFNGVITKRDDIGSYYSPEYDFGMTGFAVSADWKSDYDEICYEIHIVLDYEEEVVNGESKEIVKRCKKISTKQYLYNKKIYSYNPMEFYYPDIEDNFVKNILDKGEVLAYDLDNEIWLYLFEKQIYIIVSSDYPFVENAKTSVPVVIYTSQSDLLSDERKEYGSDNVGFYFEDNEYLGTNMNGYRITSFSVPQHYPITKIITGLYDNLQGVWLRKFTVKIS